MRLVSKNLIFLFRFAFFALLGGCISVPKYPVPKLEEKNYRPEMAIVIIKTYSIYMDDQYRVTTRWAQFDHRYKTADKHVYSFETSLIKDWKKYVPGYAVFHEQLKFSNPVSYDAYMIAPGKYVLEEFESTINNVNYKTPPSDGWDEEKQGIKWAEFTVASGEVIYLGDVEFHFAKDKAGIAATNELKYAEEFMKAEYPWLKTLPERRQITITWDKHYQRALRYIGPPKEKDGVYK